MGGEGSGNWYRFDKKTTTPASVKAWSCATSTARAC
jgi:hypothetical protein